MSFKTIDGLMRHLRNSGIAINGSSQKRQLMNTGYYHGYKGYRFFKTSNNRLPFTTYEEVYATIQFDSQLKTLFYGKMMYIETAVKNIALECVLDKAKSENIQDVFDRAVCGYKNAPTTCSIEEKSKFQKNKLSLQSMVQSYLYKGYTSGNPKITHFYNNVSYSDVPIWALIEIMTLGDFGFFLSCLTIDTREAISKKIGINLSSDTNRELVYKYLYTLKDLRNAVAHNAVIFDTRFRKIDASPAMKQTLKQEIGLPYINFKTIGDYLILTCYYLKLLKVPKTEIKAFIREFERVTDSYRSAVSSAVSSKVIHPDLQGRVAILKNAL